jgi:hypothetical protein
LEWSLVGKSNLGGCYYDTRALEISYYSKLGHQTISTKISGSLEGRKKKEARISRKEIIMKRIISSTPPITTDFQKSSKLRMNSQWSEPKAFFTTQLLNLGFKKYF